MSEYQPIACVAHERLEFAVLRRQRLNLVWRDEAGETQADTVLPIDVATQEGAEWLSFRRPDGRQGRIRLDRIVSADYHTA